MILLDAAKVSNPKLFKFKNKIERWKNLGYLPPTLAIILVGKNAASHKFVDIKVKVCKQVGIRTLVYSFPEQAYEQVILEKVDEINNDETIHGLIIQLPLPAHLSVQKILSNISVKKDVDALNPVNFGLLGTNKYSTSILPCIVLAILWLFEEYGIDPKGKNIAIIGDGLISGRALTNTLLNHQATVTTCNKFTSDISFHTKKAEIVISCVGQRNLIQDYMVNSDAVVIDVGTSVVNGTTYGDVNFDTVSKKVRMITPTPGGVGPLTVVAVIHNLLKLYHKQEIEKNF